MCVRPIIIVLFAVVFSLAFVGARAGFTDLGEGMIKRAVAQGTVEDEMAQSEEIDQGDPEAAALAKARLEALKGQLYGIKGNLGQAELSHFGIIYGNYNIYSTVKAVREDVSDAVAACIENNPEMEPQISARWGKWAKSVDKNMKEAWANINAMTLAQDYAPQDNMKRIFALIDETRRANSSRFETVPVTTPEACEFMISKMDETEDNMNMLLITTIKSYPLIMKAMQE